MYTEKQDQQLFITVPPFQKNIKTEYKKLPLLEVSGKTKFHPSGSFETVD